MKCNTCQNERYCYDGNHQLTRDGCADNGFAAYVPQTNADRIRDMTDEELANFIGFACQDAFCFGAKMRNKMMIFPFGTHEETMAWLKAPVEEVDNG